MKDAVGLRCTFGAGMFPAEYAVETMTADGKRISLFTSDEFLSKEKNLLMVNIIDRAQDIFLVRLPGYPLEVSSRFVNVNAADIVEL